MDARRRVKSNSMRCWWYAMLAAVFVSLTPAAWCQIPATPGESPGDQASHSQASVDSAPAQPPAPPGFGEMSPERRAQAIEYSDLRNRIFFIHTAYSFAVLILLLFSGWSGRIRDWAERLVRRPLGTWALYFFALSVLLLILDLPWDYYTGFALEHQYGHSNQSFGAWILDLFKGEAVGYVLGGAVAYLVYLAIRLKGARWWLWVGGFAAPVTAFFIVLFPLVVAPLFNDFKPLSNESLRTRILALAEQAGIPDSRVFEVDASRQSNKYNAYVTGLFGSKRVVLYDTILRDMNENEILFIMAHEIGHYTMHHMWIGVAGAAVFVLLTAWLIHRLGGAVLRRYGARWKFSTLGDFASFPLLALSLSIFSFLSMPLSNAVSRHFEHSADAYGLNLTQNREAAASAFEKLAARNLSNPDPSPFIEFWLYDHPTIQDRVAYVLGHQDS